VKKPPPWPSSIPLLFAASAAAQASGIGEPRSLLCWPEQARAAQLVGEATLLDDASPDRLRQWHDLLASEPHVAGTPGDLREVERIAAAFRDMGLRVQEHEFWAYLCLPDAAVLQVVSPERVDLGIREDILKEDPYTAGPDLTPGWNAYSGDGDVTAEVVYANYGTKEDFEKLATAGVECKGKIVLARYGGNFRGYKARFAQAAGAAGLIIFTDPADSGYCKGITYPEGGFAGPTCIQRGSILTLDYPGDPLTPFVEATKDAPRRDPSDVDLPKIPVQPIGWGAAQQIIGRMTGAPVPEGWQGGLPFAYRLTGGPELRVHLKVKQQRQLARTFNIVATLPGAAFPEQKVILGCHHDAWGYGAADPLAGTITLMEAARCLSDAAKAGHPPARSVVFAAWGAEEFGIIGSTEWVEANREDLTRNAAAYLNLDMASMGDDFSSSAWPSLQRVIADAAGAVPQSHGKDGQRVLDGWLARAPDPDFPGRPKFGDIGGGSDHVGFLCHAGVASAGLGAGGSKGTSYHSVYDDLAWYRKVVGDDYQSALMITRVTMIAASRLASAPLLPLEFARFGDDAPRQLQEISGRGTRLRVFAAGPAPAGPPTPPAPRIVPELGVAAHAAAEYAALAHRVEERLFERISSGRVPPETLAGINREILSIDRAWLSDPGIPGRPWFRNLYAANDEDSGYASWMLPVLRHAVEHKDPVAARAAAELYARLFADLLQRVRSIDAQLD
jgi:N-acetylated-alpha-linked acidic dipeptidase